MIKIPALKSRPVNQDQTILSSTCWLSDCMQFWWHVDCTQTTLQTRSGVGMWVTSIPMTTNTKNEISATVYMWEVSSTQRISELLFHRRKFHTNIYNKNLSHPHSLNLKKWYLTSKYHATYTTCLFDEYKGRENECWERE